MSNEALIADKKIIKRIQKEIDKANLTFGDWEKIKAFELTSEIWSIENGLLTPTLKMKRKEIKHKFKNLYKMLFTKNNINLR